MDKITFSVLSFGLDEYTKKTLQKASPNIQFIDKPYTAEELMGEPISPLPIMIVCGAAPVDVPLTEVAQALRMQYQNHQIYFTTLERNGFDQKIFKKNGFSDAFLLPMDAETLMASALDQLAKGPGQAPSYRKVKLLDLSADTVLEFDAYIHLPQNNKTIRIASEGNVFDEKNASKFSKNNVQSLLVRRDQMTKFYEYTAKQLTKIGKNGAMSETERKAKTESMIRDLFSGLYSDTSDSNFDQGKAFVEDCHQIVNAYLASNTSEQGWYEKLVSGDGLDSSTYSHSSNTATYAALFSIALGIGRPDEIAMAALLHDVGLANVPIEIQEKPEAQRTPEEKALYEKHPFYSIEMIKSRKMSVNEVTIKFIMQHHERYDGKGFPNALLGTRIRPEAQILAIADRFDELCSGANQQKKMLPKHALERIDEECRKNVSDVPYDPALVSRIKSIFSPTNDESEKQKLETA